MAYFEYFVFDTNPQQGFNIFDSPKFGDVILIGTEDLDVDVYQSHIRLSNDVIKTLLEEIGIETYNGGVSEGVILSTVVKSSTTLYMRPDFTCGSPANDGFFYRYGDLAMSFDFDIIDATNAARVSASIKSEAVNTFIPGVGDDRRCWHMEVFMYKGEGVPASYVCSTKDIPLYLENWMLIDNIPIYNDRYVRSEGGLSVYEGSAFYEFPNTNRYFVIIPTRDLSKVSDTLYIKFMADISYASSIQQMEIK